jgi:hypothetical protein
MPLISTTRAIQIFQLKVESNHQEFVQQRLFEQRDYIPGKENLLTVFGGCEPGGLME